MLDNIWNAISSIPDKIEELITAIGDFFKFCFDAISEIPKVIGAILDVLNPFSENFFLKGFFTTLFDYLNPFSENFILKKIISGIFTILDYLNPFSENFILKTLFTWIGNFFNDMWDLIYHIFVPTDEQWEDIGNDYKQMGDTVKSHVPFVGLFSDELKKAQATVEKTDPLVIRIPTFNYSGSGGIGINTGTKEINLTQVYEPYRAYVRGFLLLVVVALAFVYIIKYVLNYGVTSGTNSGVDTGNGKGGDDS